jgi:hypothetical protein
MQIVRLGSYHVSVSKTGFKEADSSVTVGVSQAVTVNVRLDVGLVTEKVDVAAEGSLLQTTTTELGTVIQQRVVNDLPLNDRNFTQLLTLTPGVTPVSTSQNRNVGCCEGNVASPDPVFPIHPSTVSRTVPSCISSMESLTRIFADRRIS